MGSAALDEVLAKSIAEQIQNEVFELSLYVSSMEVVCTVAISYWLNVLRTSRVHSTAAHSEMNVRLRQAVATGDFSGLIRPSAADQARLLGNQFNVIAVAAALGKAQADLLGRKVSDEFTVPLCRGHNREIHRCGDEAAWWKKAGIDPTIPARVLWLQSHPLPTPSGNDQSTATPGRRIGRWSEPQNKANF